MKYVYEVENKKKMKTRIDATFKMASNDTNDPFDVDLVYNQKFHFSKSATRKANCVCGRIT